MVVKDDAPQSPGTLTTKHEGVPDLGSWTGNAGRYELADEIGRGGGGRVIAALDRRLGRTVAVKYPLEEPGSLQRLVREAQLIARLEHASIVPVHDLVRASDGTPFYVMKLIDGDTLRARISGRPFDDRIAYLPTMIAIAEAIAYAHHRGIIHRDLKPGNVVVGAYGETFVIDWGLAIGIAEPGAPAGHGGVTGTPAYMAPEQARGDAADARTDVYGLGAVMYHVLCGEPPYSGGDSSAVIARVLERPPRDLREREPRVPAELATIVNKAMARRREDRYATAQELASDLRHYQAGRLVDAHPYSAWTLLRRWLRRHRVSVGVAVLAAVFLTVQGLVSLRRITAARAEAERRRDALTLLQARASLAKDPTLAVAWLKQYPTGGADWASARTLAADALDRGVAEHSFGHVALARVSADGQLLALNGTPTLRLWREGRARVVDMPDGNLSALALSPDGKTLATFSRDGTLRVRATDGGPARTLWSAGEDGVIVGEARFSPDGTHLAVMAARDQVWLFSLDGSAPRRFEARSLVYEIAFSPDGRWLAAATRDKLALIWRLDDGRERTLAGHGSDVRALDFSPDGTQLVTAGHDATVRIWPVEGEGHRELRGHDGRVFTARFLRDGRVVSGGDDGTVRLWESDGRSRVLGRHAPGAVLALDVSSDGKRIASAGEDQIARVFDLDRGDDWTLRGHTGPILRVELFDGGRRLLSWGFDNVARVWELRPPARHTLLQAAEAISSVAWAPDGRWLAVAGRDHSVRLCERRSARSSDCRTIGSHLGPVLSLAVSPDGTTLASGSADGELRLWNPEAGTYRSLAGPRAAVKRLAFSPDGRELVSGGEERAVWLWDVASGAGREVLAFDDVVTWVGFAPDGARIGATSLDGTVRLWSRDGQVTALRGHGDRVRSAAFAPDGQRLASGGKDGTVRLWSSGRGEVVGRHDNGVVAVAFSPDGRWLASAGNDKTARLWNLVTGEQRMLRGHEANLRAVVFAPDGRRLATSSDDRTLRIWELATGEARVLRGHDAIITTLAWSPDGTRLASGSADRIVRLWHLDELAPLPGAPSVASALLARASTVTLDDDDDEPETR